MPVSCEVCGSCTASAAFVLCVACKPGRQAGCHTFCLPGPQHSIGSRAQAFTCMTCSSPGHVRRERAAKKTAAGARAGAATGARQKADTQPARARPAAARGAGAAGGAESAAITHAGPTTAPAHKKAASSLVGWTQLPSEVLSVILQHVPQQHRFSRCALVSTAWAAAAAAGTRSISIKRQSAVKLQRSWAACARSYASQLTHLSLHADSSWMCLKSVVRESCDSPCLLYLPCARLRALEVYGVPVQLMSEQALHPASPDSSVHAAQLAGPSLPGLLDTATGLTRLRLVDVKLVGRPDEQLRAFAALTDLESLSMTAPWQRPSFIVGINGQLMIDQLLTLLPDSFMGQLRQLTKLTSLQLSANGQALWSGAGSQQLSCLTALQRLSLAAGEGYCWCNSPMLFSESANGLQRLTALTSLELVGFIGSTIPSMGALSALQHIVLHDCYHFDPSTLLGLTTLVHLEVLNNRQPDTPPQSNRALLSVLQRQQQLTHLQLNSFLTEADASDYSALTASSMLHTLQLSRLQVPAGAWQYAFQPGRLLQHLTCLQLAGQNLSCLSAGEMLLLVQACPVLRELSLCSLSNSNSCDCWADLQLGMLTGLVHLTRLSVAGTEDEQLPQVVQLTQLQDLSFRSSYFSFERVPELTAMHQLTCLHLSLPVSRQGPFSLFESLTLQCASPDTPPVHEQLQQRWQVCMERREQRRKERKFGVLLQMGVPLEGYPTGPHGRALRSSRTAKQQ